MCVTGASSSCDCCKAGSSVCEVSSSVFFCEGERGLSLLLTRYPLSVGRLEKIVLERKKESMRSVPDWSVSSRKNFVFLFGALINLTVRIDAYFHPIRMTYPIQPGQFFRAAPNWGKPAKHFLFLRSFRIGQT